MAGRWQGPWAVADGQEVVVGFLGALAGLGLVVLEQVIWRPIEPVSYPFRTGGQVSGVKEPMRFRRRIIINP